jgi:hypothetical protein
MFRAELCHDADGPILRMVGRLVGDWALEAKSLVIETSVIEGLIVDLNEVTYVDATGEQELNSLKNLGAVFAAKSVYSSGVCERLGLPVRGNTNERLK